MKRLWLIVSALAAAAGCTPDRCNTPIGPGGQFDLTLPAYAAIGTVGAQAITHDIYGQVVGHRGIYVRRVTFTDFVAFEMSCPEDHEVQLVPDAENDVLLSCPGCGSRFETINGNPLEGSATACALYQYTADFDGQTLLIY